MDNVAGGNKKVYILAGLIILVFVFAWLIATRAEPTPSSKTQPQTPSGPTHPLPEETSEQILLPRSPWKFTLLKPSMLFTGGYADPSVIELPDKNYLMYLNKINRGTFVLSSTNAFSWNKKTDVVFSGIATGRAFIVDNGIRFFYPKLQRIYSSFSQDGLGNWREESIVLSPRAEYRLEAPVVFRLKDGSYRMFFGEVKQSSSDNILAGEIYGATSTDGVLWDRDSVATIIFERNIEGFGQDNAPLQVLRPFVLNWTNPKTKNVGYLMLYNSHSKIFAATSPNGFEWEKLGYTGIEGTGVDGIYATDGLRIYYGHSVAEGLVYTGILEITHP